MLRTYDPSPKDIIWNPWVLTKLGFFSWEATWGRILTMNQLRKRDWTLVSRCFFCKDEKEAAAAFASQYQDKNLVASSFHIVQGEIDDASFS